MNKQWDVKRNYTFEELKEMANWYLRNKVPYLKLNDEGQLERHLHFILQIQSEYGGITKRGIWRGFFCYLRRMAKMQDGDRQQNFTYKELKKITKDLVPNKIYKMICKTGRLDGVINEISREQKQNGGTLSYRDIFIHFYRTC